jgi:hypothetical protein
MTTTEVCDSGVAEQHNGASCSSSHVKHPSGLDMRAESCVNRPTSDRQPRSPELSILRVIQLCP